MFEQESYDRAAVQTASVPPGELFSRYEIKNWEFSPLIYKILAASAVLHIAALAFITQTNVLTMRGCDSPWVGRVCQVVDMTYLGTVLAGTKSEYADVDYEPTQLNPETDDITYIIVSDDKLEYPEGYFHLANPEQFVVGNDPMAPGFAPAAGFPQPSYNPYTPQPNNDSDLLKIRPNPPAANPDAFKDDSASSLFKVDNGAGTPTMPRTARNRKNRAVANAKPEDPALANKNTNPAVPPAAQPSPDPGETAAADDNGVFLNKRPLEDKARYTLEQVEAQKVKLDNPFKVTIKGTLGLAKDGKTVVLKDPTPVAVDPNIPNDPALVKLAQDWIVAVGDSGWLGYLDLLDVDKKIKSKKVVITVEQGQTDFSTNIRFELPSENVAKQAASALNLLIAGGKMKAELKGRQDELTFLNSASTSNDVNNLVLNVQMPKDQVQQMIQRKLAESKTPPAQPSSTASNNAGSSNASR